MIIDRPQRLVQLDVRTVWQPLDNAGLDSVLEHVAVAALQSHSPPVGDEEHQRRKYEHADPADPRHCVQGDVECVRDDVVTRAERQHHVEGDRHRPDTGTHRNVTRALQQVVVSVVAGESPF